MCDALRKSYAATSMKDLVSQTQYHARQELAKRAESLNEKIRLNKKCDNVLACFVRDLLDFWDTECALFDEELRERHEGDPEHANAVYEHNFHDFLNILLVWHPHVKWAVREFVDERY